MTDALVFHRYRAPVLVAVALSLLAAPARPGDIAVTEGHDHQALPVDESLTLTATIDAAFGAFPARAELNAQDVQADAWRNRGGSWLADRPALIFRYQSDRWGPGNGLEEYEVGVELPLWNPGGRSAVQALGNAFFAEAEFAALALRWEVAGHVRRALWDIALAENEHDLALESLGVATRLSELVARRYELGDVALRDVLMAQTHVLEALTTANENTALLLDAERMFRSITGLERRPPFSGELLSELDEISPEHPALAQANAQLSRADAETEVADKTSNTGAHLLVGSRSERPVFGTGHDDSIGLTLSFPFGGSSHRETEISKAARAAAIARANRDQLLRDLTLALHESAHNLNVVGQNIASASERMALAERQRAMADSAYQSGEIDLSDLLIVQAVAQSAKSQLSNLQIEEKRQIALYNQAVGRNP